MIYLTGKKQKGFSLIELLFVIVIIGILAAFFLGGSSNTSIDAKKVLSSAQYAVIERRSAAISLMQPNGQDGEIKRLPVGIDFTKSDTTAVLLIEGEDLNADGVDDNSGQNITTWVSGANKWQFGYASSPMELPAGWSTAVSADDLSPIPLIPNSVLTTEIYFNEEGKPSSAAGGAGTSGEASFWTIYFKDRKAGNLAVAVAVHGSGLIEEWRYDPTTGKWTGHGGR